MHDDSTWTSLTNSEANDLLESMKAGTSGDAIFIYYLDTCSYCQDYVPQFYDFAVENGL